MLAGLVVLLALFCSLCSFHLLFMFFSCSFIVFFMLLSFSFHVLSFPFHLLVLSCPFDFLSFPVHFLSFPLHFVLIGFMHSISFRWISSIHVISVSMLSISVSFSFKKLQINPDFVYYLFINNYVRLLRGTLLPNHKPAQKVGPVICYPMHYLDITFGSELFFIYHAFKIVTFEH